MNRDHRTARRAGVLLVVLGIVLGAAGCGVRSEDVPQLIEETSIRQPPAPPSVDTETAPMTSESPTPTSTTSDSRQTSPPPVTEPVRTSPGPRPAG